MAPEIRVEREADIARVTIDHEARRNALSSDLLGELCAAFDALAEEPLPHAVVLSGAGDKAFAGGARLDELGRLDAYSAKRFITGVHEACNAVRRFPAPVIARIRGHVLGAGLELAAACDLRIAAEDAMFGMPEVRFGIPSVVEAALLPRMIGRGRASWLVLTGRLLDARQALGWGLIEELVPAAELDRAVEDALQTLRAMSAGALRAQKRLINIWDDEPLPDGIAKSIDLFAECYAGGEPGRLIAEYFAARARKPAA